MNLADRQAELVAALVAGEPMPPGFSERGLTAARDALMRKRAGEVANTWPELARAYGKQWRPVFAVWAAQRAPQESLRDGWDLARQHQPSLPELLAREAFWRYDGHSAPRKRNPAVSWLVRLGHKLRSRRRS